MHGGGPSRAPPTAASSWRRIPERASLRTLRAALAVDEAAALAGIDAALTEQDAGLEALLQRMPPSQAQHEARTAFTTQTLQICSGALAARDRRMLQAVSDRGADGFCSLQLLGELIPPCMPFRELGHAAALARLAAVMEHTRDTRAHELAQRLARQVSVSRGRAGGGAPPAALAHPEVASLLSATDVGRLRERGSLVIDPSPAWLTAEEMHEAEAELRAHVAATGMESKSSCNTHAVTSSLPLDGGEFVRCASTKRLLRLLSAVPAAIEAHGWPRTLSLPPLLQLGAYNAWSGARYTRHLDNNDWEQANRREITILLYVNQGWDAEANGGCLRLHSSEGGGGGTVDVEPIGGRLVIFPSAHVPHEVLPCSAGERLALTLWLEHA